MRIFPPPLEIGDREGFTPEKDIFGRAKLGEGLSNVVHSVSDPMVIAVDAQWGSGKTTFLRMWASELRKNGTPVIYFDAFANDYLDDAFIAIASEIIALAAEHEAQDKTGIEEFTTKATNVGKILARSGLKLGIKLATLNTLDGTEFEDIASEVSGEANKIIEAHIGGLLAAQSEKLATIEAFRSALSELPSILSEAPSNDEEKGNKKPLIFIIDELDRCRPDFALEVLERIKHFFNVPNVHFILGTHLEQLRNTVRVRYGDRIDAKTYLQKFVHLEFFLTNKIDESDHEIIPRFVNYLIDSLDFNDEDMSDVKFAAETIILVATTNDISLRSIERIFGTLALSLAYSTKSQYRLPDILGGLCVLKVTHPELYKKAKAKTLSSTEANEALNLYKITQKSNWIVELWAYCLDQNVNRETEVKIMQSIGMNGFHDRSEIIPYIANNIIDKMIVPN